MTGADAGPADLPRGARSAWIWRVPLFLVLTLGVATLGAAALPDGLLSGAIALLLGSLLAGWGLLRLHGRGPGALGFHLGPGAVREALVGSALGLVVGATVVGTIALAGGVRWAPQPGDAGAWLTGGVSALAFLAIPAAAEEAFLRGYPLQALSEAWGPAGALVATSLAFGALHLGNPEVTPLAALNISLAGLFLGVLYLRTASLWCASGAHLGWNWCHGFLFDVPVSGLEVLDAPLYEGQARGPEWLGGGGFGPEGSVVATLVVALAALVCWRASWLTPGPGALAARPLAVAGEVAA